MRYTTERESRERQCAQYIYTPYRVSMHIISENQGSNRDGDKPWQACRLRARWNEAVGQGLGEFRASGSWPTFLGGDPAEALLTSRVLIINQSANQSDIQSNKPTHRPGAAAAPGAIPVLFLQFGSAVGNDSGPNQMAISAVARG